MDVYETEVPGVGQKYELPLEDDDRLVVIVHHDGKRDVYRRPSEDADSEQLFTLTGDQARVLGSILEGAYFQPLELESVQVPLGEAVIEWYEVDDASPLAGRTLADANVRERTGTSVMAVQRGTETVPNPTPETVVEAGDTLVVLGTREEQDDFESQCLRE